MPDRRTTRQSAIKGLVVTLADLAPRHEVKGGAARVFGEASGAVVKNVPQRAEPTRKPTKHR